MKKVGIITLGGLYNYGNRLQAYATTKIYHDKGFQPFCLYCKDRLIISELVKSFARTLLKKPPVETPKLIESKMSNARLNSFREFNTLIPTLNITNNKQLKSFDFFSVGSDQVWNPGIIRHYEKWYYLKFAPSNKKIALAPSIGLDSLNEKQTKQLVKGLSGFNKLSIREDAGAKIILKASGRNASVICDPTLVISASDWRSISSDKYTPPIPYIFTYLLGGFGTEALNALDDIFKVKGKLPIVSLSDREKNNEPPAGPAEFISLIDNAAYVITDSFHAAVFSSILQTPLIIVHRDGPSMFSRLETLAQTLHIENKIYGSPLYTFDSIDDYSDVENAIRAESSAFNIYLDDCLHDFYSNIN